MKGLYNNKSNYFVKREEIEISSGKRVVLPASTVAINKCLSYKLIPKRLIK